MSEKAVEFKGVAFVMVLVVLAVLGSNLPCRCLSYKIQDQEATMTALAVVAVSVMTATPLRLNPLECVTS